MVVIESKRRKRENIYKLRSIRLINKLQNQWNVR